jgi:protein arginine N-methyltransferase 1
VAARPRDDPFGRARTHQALLSDRVRTSAYRQAIEAAVRPRDVVLDLGCGTGIFSMVAARRGCRKVYAVDRSALIDEARAAAARNGLDGRIEFIRAPFDALELPERVDLVVHELIGSGFWDEDVLASVAGARRRHLKRGGRILPFRLDVLIAPTSYRSELERSIAFWARRREGFDLGQFGRLAFEQAAADALHPTNVALRDGATLLAPPQVVFRADLRRTATLPGEVRASFRLRRRQRLTGLVAFLRVHLDARRSFTTGPGRPGTHWGQLFLPAFEPIAVGKDARLDVALSMAVRPIDWRWTLRLGR